MLVKPSSTTKTVNSIDLAKVIEKLFHLDLAALYTLPLHAQLAILARAAKHQQVSMKGVR